MGLIVGLSGRKQSGKGTICKYIAKNCCKFIKPNESCVAETREYLYADKLKEICMNLLGLTRKQCYGTNDDKNTLTSVKWENLPHYEDLKQQIINKFLKQTGKEWEFDDGENSLVQYQLDRRHEIVYPEGYMKAREVLQHVGTDIFRRMNNNCWVDATIKQIKENDFGSIEKLAVITDVRFPNEADAVLNNDGILIRLLRAPFVEDEHESETGLDNYNFVRKNCFIIDNRNQALEETLYTIDKVFEQYNEDQITQKSNN